MKNGSVWLLEDALALVREARDESEEGSPRRHALDTAVNNLVQVLEDETGNTYEE